MSDTNERATIGDNSGDLMHCPTPEVISDTLAARYETETIRLKELSAGIDRFMAQCADGIPDETVMSKSSDFVAQIGRFMKTLETFREGEKTPFNTAGNTVQNFFKKGMLDVLEAGRTKIAAKQTTYLRRVEQEKRAEALEAARLARIEADRLAAEALAASEAEKASAPAAFNDAIVAEKEAVQIERKAVAPSADLTRTRGDLGGVTSLKTTKKWRLVDITKLPHDYLSVNEAMVKAKLSGWKEGDDQPLAGVEFYTDRGAATR